MRTAYEMRISDWSSDVCSSDLHAAERQRQGIGQQGEAVERTMGLVEREARQGEAVGGTAGGAGLLAERGGKAGIDHGLAQGKADFAIGVGERSEERRVGKEWVRTRSMRWSPYS